MVIFENIDIDIDINNANLKNIDIDKEILVNIDIDIDKEVLENIDIDIDKEIWENIDIDKISNRLEFGISNRASVGGARRSAAVTNSIEKLPAGRVEGEGGQFQVALSLTTRSRQDGSICFSI